MGSQLGGEMQVTCLCVHPAGMAPKMGLRHRFPALGRQAGGRVLPRVSAATAACSRLRSLGSALAGRALQQLQRRLSWRMVKETSDQASFPWRNWKLSRCQATGNKSLHCHFQIGREYICSTFKIHRNLKPKGKTADKNPTRERFISSSYYFSSSSFSQSLTIPIM